MSAITQVIEADRRLILLRSLDDSPGFTANESILRSTLETYGHHCTRDQVHTLLDWLAEQNLLTVRTVSGLRIATLSKRGRDVARGLAIVSGVKRPGPREED